MRFLLFVIASCFAMLLLATSCASPKRSTIRYSPPSFTPVREKLSDAQNFAVAEATAAGAAQAAIAKAQSFVPPSSNPQLEESLAEASGQVGMLQTANSGLQAALKVVTDRLALVESASKNQTTLLNAANDAKNAAITARDEAVSKYHKLKFLVCLLAAIAAGLLVFQFRGMLALLGPWGYAAYAVVPGAVFTFLWLRL